MRTLRYAGTILISMRDAWEGPAEDCDHATACDACTARYAASHAEKEHAADEDYAEDVAAWERGGERGDPPRLARTDYDPPYDCGHTATPCDACVERQADYDDACEEWDGRAVALAAGWRGMSRRERTDEIHAMARIEAKWGASPATDDLQAVLEARHPTPAEAPRPKHPIGWIVPPVCQGQIVEVAYGDSRDGWAWRMTEDRSDGTVAYAYADMADCGCEGECDCWDPANCEPSAYDWTICEEPRPRHGGES